MLKSSTSTGQVVQKATVARMVLVTVDPHTNNGGDVAPAVITRVWSDTLVNLRVLLDGASSVPAATSVELYQDEAAAWAAVASKRDAFAAAGGDVQHYHPTVAYWPPRV